MKKTTGICLFLALLLACVTGLFFLYKPDRESLPEEPPQLMAEEETAEPEELAQSMSIQEPYAYLLREKDGFLAVYGQDGTTFLFETNIRMRSLDEEMQAKVEAGIPFADERELYDFLESYSS